MSSIGGEVIQACKAANVVGNRVWRADKVPERPTFPYITVLDMIYDVPALSGDCSTIARTRGVQVDLWQKSADEVVTLAEQLVDALDGANLTANQRVHGARGADCQRIDDPNPQIIHHAITLNISHGQAVTV